MTSLFSDAGMRRLDDIVQPGMLCAFDFDGTLAPIVAQPDQARLPPEVLQRLIMLSGYAPIAIITGRAITDIAPRLGFDPDYLVGNHGLEGVPGWQARSDAFAALCHDWREMLSAVLQDSSRYDPGIAMEDKRYSLSVHYRHARDPVKAEAQLTDLLEKLEPAPRIVAGKYVFNVVPQDGADKGDALEELMRISAARSAIYVGDDVTDEDAFRLKRADLLPVRIEDSAHSDAEFFLPDWHGILQLLDELIGRLRTHHGDKPPRSPLVQHS
jgi:trehalose 6-phosphate phosphatase